jgi:hypothetical protein
VQPKSEKSSSICEPAIIPPAPAATSSCNDDFMKGFNLSLQVFKDGSAHNSAIYSNIFPIFNNAIAIAAGSGGGGFGRSGQQQQFNNGGGGGNMGFGNSGFGGANNNAQQQQQQQQQFNNGGYGRNMGWGNY